MARTLELLDADGEPTIGFDLTEDAFETAAEGSLILQHEGVTYIFDDAFDDTVVFAPVKIFVPTSGDGETYEFKELEKNAQNCG